MTKAFGWFAQLLGLAISTMAMGAQPPNPPPVGAYLTPQTNVKLPDGRRFNLVCMGDGSPVAILDGSLSQWSFEWRSIQPALAKITRTCAVDRAGFGFSDTGPFPRDAAAEVSDLTNALTAAKINAPYVLVGHSLGDQEMRLFAYQHPNKVSGMLLIDPGVDHFDRVLPYPPGYFEADLPFYKYCFEQAEAGKLVPGFVRKGDEDACADPPSPKRPIDEQKRIIALVTRPSKFMATAAEISSYNGTTSQELGTARRRLGSIPLIILSSDKAHFTEDRPPAVDADVLYSAWIAAHVDQAHDSLKGQNRIVEGASHWIFNERPDVVLSAFREVIEDARAAKGMTAAQ